MHLVSIDRARFLYFHSPSLCGWSRYVVTTGHWLRPAPSYQTSGFYVNQKARKTLSASAEIETSLHFGNSVGADEVNE